MNFDFKDVNEESLKIARALLEQFVKLTEKTEGTIILNIHTETRHYRITYGVVSEEAQP